MFLQKPILTVVALLLGTSQGSTAANGSSEVEPVVVINLSAPVPESVQRHLRFLEAAFPVRDYGLHVDSIELLGQLVIADLDRVGASSKELESVRAYFIANDVLEGALELPTARIAIKDWLETATFRDPINRSLVKSLQILSKGWGVKAVPRLDREAPSPESIEQAQLRILGMKHQKRVPVSSIQREIDRYVQWDLIPPTAFENEALIEVATRETAELVSKLPARSRPRQVAMATRKWGIDRKRIYAHLQSNDRDVAGEIEAYLNELGSAKSREAVDKVMTNWRRKRNGLRAVVLRPADTLSIIQVLERNDSIEAFRICHEFLRGDWSLEGEEFLYQELATSRNPEQRKIISQVLASREAQFNDVVFAKIVKQSDDEKVWKYIVSLAAAAQRNGDDSGEAFLWSILDDPRPEVKSLAFEELAMLAMSEREGDARLISRAAAEVDDEARAAMIKHLNYLASRPSVSEFLIQTVEGDVATTVRIAALESILLVAGKGERAQAESEQVIQTLRRIVGNKGGDLRGALDAKIQRYQEQMVRLEGKTPQTP